MAGQGSVMFGWSWTEMSVLGSQVFGQASEWTGVPFMGTVHKYIRQIRRVLIPPASAVSNFHQIVYSPFIRIFQAPSFP